MQTGIDTVRTQRDVRHFLVEEGGHFQRERLAGSKSQPCMPGPVDRSKYIHIDIVYIYTNNVHTYIWPVIYTYVYNVNKRRYYENRKQVSITSSRIANAKQSECLKILEYRNMICNKQQTFTNSVCGGIVACPFSGFALPLPKNRVD